MPHCRRFTSLLAVLAVGLPAGADTAPRSFDPAAIDAYLARQVTTGGHVGLSVALVRDGKVVLARGYGKASLDPAAPVGTDTAFAAGSITKQFTCACVLLLAEDGKLSVRDRVAKYYPDLTRAEDITLYDLMTHAAGYPDYYPLDFVDRRMMKPVPPDHLLRQYAGRKLDFEPGTRWSYSNTGYILLGRVVEKVSGLSFGEFLTRRILQPLKMGNTVYEPGPDHPKLAAGHTAFALGKPEPATREADGWIHAAGGLYSTPADLAKWNLALVTGQVLKPESYRLMTAPRELADGRIKEYGCGIGVIRRQGETVLRHSGAVSGFLAYSAVVPRTRSSVVLMANGEHLDVGEIYTTLLDLLLQSHAPASDVPAVRGLAPKEAALALLQQLQAGRVDREQLGEEYNAFLTPERVQGAKERLGPLGRPTDIEVQPSTERGGMEVTTVYFTFGTVRVKALLYRTPDGKIQEFLLYRS